MITRENFGRAEYEAVCNRCTFLWAHVATDMPASWYDEVESRVLFRIATRLARKPITRSGLSAFVGATMRSVVMHYREEMRPEAWEPMFDVTDADIARNDARYAAKKATIAALKASDGSVSAAARALGITRDALYKRMREMRIHR